MKTVNIMMKEPRAETAFRRWDELKQHRAMHEPDWEDIARLIRPQRGGFGNSEHAKRKMEKPLNSEPILAQSSFAAGIYSSITNPANRWAGLETPDKELNAWKPMAEWNDVVTAKVMLSFGPSMSSFYSSTFQAYSDIAAFGNAATYDELDIGRRKFADVSLSLAEVVVDIDAYGQVIEMARRYQLSPIAAMRAFRKNSDYLPPKLVEMAEKHATGDITFVKHIVPNDHWRKGSLGPRGKRWLSHTACEIENTLVRVGGYDDMPAYFPRWDVDSGMRYGTGPGFIALASARVVQRMDAATIRAAQFAADPAKLAPDPQSFPINGHVRPGQMVYGGTDMRGNPLIRNMEINPNIGLTMEEKRAKTEAVKDAFHYAIMSLSGRTGVTSEESRIMEEARLRNWAPHADRIMEEYGARKVERRFQLLWRAGQIPPPPEGIPTNMPLQVRYQSAATMAQKAREGMAIRQFISDLGPLAQMDPRYVDRVDPDGLTEALHDASPSLPASILRSRDQADQLAAQRAEQQQQAQLMEMAQAGGGVVKDLAGALGGTGGGQ